MSGTGVRATPVPLLRGSKTTHVPLLRGAWIENESRGADAVHGADAVDRAAEATYTTADGTSRTKSADEPRHRRSPFHRARRARRVAHVASRRA